MANKSVVFITSAVLLVGLGAGGGIAYLNSNAPVKGNIVNKVFVPAGSDVDTPGVNEDVDAYCFEIQPQGGGDIRVRCTVASNGEGVEIGGLVSF